LNSEYVESYKFNDPAEMVHNFGKIYNDATNHLAAFYQIDGFETMDIIGKLIKEA